MIVALLRHGRTAWNDAGRMQGRADIPLSDVGRDQVRRWRFPEALRDAGIVTSPLARAVETAALLGDGAQVIAVDALTEMHWGDWEGATLAALRSKHHALFEAHSARGLDFRPPGGESPRDVQRRFTAWLASVARDSGPLIAITHKGVIRAALSLATGWDMVGKPPVRIADDVVHLCDLDDRGDLRTVTWNVGLIDGPVAPRHRAAVPLDSAAPAASDAATAREP